MSVHEVLQEVGDYIRSYGDGFLVPMLMKSDSPVLVVHSRVIDPYLLHFGTLRLVLRVGETEDELSVNLLTRAQTPFRGPIRVEVAHLKSSTEFNSLLDILASEDISSCTGILKESSFRRTQVLRERLGAYIVIRSPECALVVQGKKGICAPCAQLNAKAKETQTKPSLEEPKKLTSRKRARKPRNKESKVPLECPSCSKVLDTILAFKEHVKSHEDVFLCTHLDNCIKTFRSQIYLDIHVRRHLGIKKSYVCPQCSKSFLSNADLKAHAFTHSGERPFACDVCGKRFIKKSHLEIHSRVHTGEKPHLCSECGTSFASHSTLIDHHKRRHLQFRPHRCPSCRKDFFSKHELSAHVLIHSGKKPFSCSLCEKNFNRLHHLKRHKAALHKDEMEAMQAEEVDDDVGNPEVHESIVIQTNYEIGTRDEKPPFNIIPDDAASSLLGLSQIEEDDNSVSDYENAKYVIIEGDDGSAKLIQYPGDFDA